MYQEKDIHSLKRFILDYSAVLSGGFSDHAKPHEENNVDSFLPISVLCHHMDDGFHPKHPEESGRGAGPETRKGFGQELSFGITIHSISMQRSKLSCWRQQTKSFSDVAEEEIHHSFIVSRGVANKMYSTNIEGFLFVKKGCCRVLTRQLPLWVVLHSKKKKSYCSWYF